MLDQITHLFRLRAVVDEGSMRAAADRLGVTQPALTRSIAQLESRFGKQLLVRHARGVTPTEFGTRVISSVNRLSRHWEIAEGDLAEAGRGNSGTFRITAGPLWRAVVLPTVITQLQQEFPNLRVEMRSGSFQTTVPDLLEGRVDAIFGGVNIAEEPLPRLVRRQFTTVYDRVMAREDHPIFADLVDGVLPDPKRVLDFPWIVYSADPVYELETIHGTIERLGRPPDIRIRSESMTATFSFLQKGNYLCVLPASAVAGVSSPRILSLPVELGHRTIQSGVLYREEIADWPPMVEVLSLSAAYFDGLSSKP